MNIAVRGIGIISALGNGAGETLAALRGMEMEEVGWFLEHFAEAFGLTLDGLQKG